MDSLATTGGREQKAGRTAAIPFRVDSLTSLTIWKGTTPKGVVDSIEGCQEDGNVWLDAAVAVGGDAKKIDEANTEMDKAQREIDKGHFDHAIKHYGHAWRDALKALK